MAPGLSLAGGLAVLAVGVILVPQFTQKRSAEVALSAYRGLENSTVPEGRPLHISLNANDLSSGPVAVELVDERGMKLWQGLSTVEGDKVEVSVPRISERGTHFLRLYTPKPGQTEGDLVREFAFQVK
jgi:hypothetical protein